MNEAPDVELIDVFETVTLLLVEIKNGYIIFLHC